MISYHYLIKPININLVQPIIINLVQPIKPTNMLKSRNMVRIMCEAAE